MIVGTTKQDYLTTNLKANDIILSKEIEGEIDNAYLELENQIKDIHNVSIRKFRGLNKKYY